jgi:hypothetical protein
MLTQEQEREICKELDRRRRFSTPSPEGVVDVADSLKVNLSLDDYHEIIRKFGRPFSQWFCPAYVVGFISAYLAGRVRSVLDPAAGFGALIIPVVEAMGAMEATALTRNERDCNFGKRFDRNGIISWQCDDLVAQIDSLHQSFDLIVSFPPLGLRDSSSDAGLANVLSDDIDVRDDFGSLLILRSLFKLSETGMGIFIVPSSFIDHRNSKSVYNALPRLGFQLSAFISLPEGTLLPLSSTQSGMAIARKGPPDKIFVGELTDDPSRARILLNNLQTRTQAKDIPLGRLISVEEFRGYHSLLVQEVARAMAGRLGLETVPLTAIAVEINSTKATELPGFDDRSNALYLPMIGRSEAVASLADLNLKPHNYFQLVIDSDKADARYLAGFLNTPLGLAFRESAFSGTYIPKLTKSSLGDVRVYFPDLATQLRTLDTQLRIDNLTTELSELKERVWSNPRKLDETREQLNRVNREDRFSDWLDCLPYPLAIILWAYHAAAGNDRSQHDHLSHFFEALAEFHATLLLSAFAADSELYDAERAKLRSILDRAHLSIQISTFGVWVRICETLMKAARTLLNGAQSDKERCKQLFHTHNVKVLESLVLSKLVSVLQETNALRNEGPAHGGVLSPTELRRRKSVLEAHLSSVRECFGNIWERYVLMLPSALQFNGITYSGTVEKVVGTRTPFEKVPIASTEPLIADRLYFMSPDESRSLLLLPFIKILESPKHAQNACYFYNRQVANGVRFISYHFEPEAEVIQNFSDTLEAIKALQ